MGVLAMLCGLLAVLQYRWIGDVSRAERERLQHGLQTSLYRLSVYFNAEIQAACTGLLPDPGRIEREGVEAAYAARYAEWKESGGHDRLFRRISLGTV